MNVLQIATVGEDLDPILLGVREFPVSKLVLVHTEDYVKQAHKVSTQLQILKLDVELRQVKGELIFEIYRLLNELQEKQAPRYDEIIVNVGSSDKMTHCAAISASYMSGIKAIDVFEDRVQLLPVLKFSYQELLSDSKFAILEGLETLGGTVESLNLLGEQVGVEKSLLSYHIRGGRNQKGLEELGLVNVDRATRGRLRLSITPMGRILVAARPARTTVTA